MLKKLMHTKLLLVVGCCINLIFIGGIYSQTYSIQGNVSTDFGPVSNALVTYIVQDGHVINFSTVTDTFGNYVLSIVYPFGEVHLSS